MMRPPGQEKTSFLTRPNPLYSGFNGCLIASHHLVIRVILSLRSSLQRNAHDSENPCKGGKA